ncbi:hypothetical protein RFEPED_0141 [Rickettsia felis str. Pedreira]|uniref:Uncharacterized protein n=1 Tax=Rickettsia felis str. Pedreira TaxID=1359196 RepID=A0A0F3MT56_RICFI|nr:hypothetical protein RFEPED_0141 [Rickettsia felis str. Pedreira]
MEISPSSDRPAFCHCDRRECGNPGKIIKKCYKLAFFTGLLRQLLT